MRRGLARAVACSLTALADGAIVAEVLLPELVERTIFFVPREVTNRVASPVFAPGRTPVLRRKKCNPGIRIGALSDSAGRKTVAITFGRLEHRCRRATEASSDGLRNRSVHRPTATFTLPNTHMP
jgi:hypothetical protein